MKTLTFIKNLFYVFVISIVVVACNKDDGGGNQNNNDDQVMTDDDNGGETSESVVDVVINTDNLTLLEEVVITADLAETLNDDGPFTIFAPSDAAIQALLDLLGDDYTSITDFDDATELALLQQILLYHVVPAQVLSTDLAEGMVDTLRDDQTIEIIDSGTGFLLGDASDIDANIIEADNTAVNGVVHIIDKILISQEVADLLALLGIEINDPGEGATGTTVKDIIVENSEFQALEELLVITDLLDTLGAEDASFTVFAPSSEYIDSLLAMFGGSITEVIVENDADLEDFEFEINLLREVLLYHVLNSEVYSTDLTAGMVETLLTGQNIEVLAIDEGFALTDATNLNANFVETDIEASNGVIHSINRVLVPQTTIDTLQEEYDMNIDILIAESGDDIEAFLDTLENQEIALTAIGLVSDSLEEVFNGEPYTFFLPTNEAFLNLFEGLDGIDSIEDFDTEEELLFLGNILLYHCIADTTALAADLTDGQIFTAVQGEELSISIENGSVFINDKTDDTAVVTSADITFFNGVIHLIDKVLLPQEILDFL